MIDPTSKHRSRTKGSREHHADLWTGLGRLLREGRIPIRPSAREVVRQLTSHPKTHGIEQGAGFVRVGLTKIKMRKPQS